MLVRRDARLGRPTLSRAVVGYSTRVALPAPKHDAELAPDPVVEAYKPGVDRTLLRENLRLTTTERAEKMIAALRFAEEVRRSRVKAKGP